MTSYVLLSLDVKPSEALETQKGGEGAREGEQVDILPSAANRLQVDLKRNLMSLMRQVGSYYLFRLSDKRKKY